MALLLLLACFLLATAAATPAVAAMDNGTHDGSKTATSRQVLCTGAGCEPPAQPLPIYGYPPPAPSLPPAPPAPPAAPGSQTPCPPAATVVCCGGGQYMPQQPNNYGPPGGYVPYYNASVAPPVLLAPVKAGYFGIVIACIILLWTEV